MRMLDKIAHWLEPDRADEIAVAEAGAQAAKERLNMVSARDTAVSMTLRSHQIDRERNHYGERIMNALRGAPL